MEIKREKEKKGKKKVSTYEIKSLLSSNSSPFVSAHLVMRQFYSKHIVIVKESIPRSGDCQIFVYVGVELVLG